MTKTAFITGITGQDGAYLARLLLEKGYEVHGGVRRTSALHTTRLEALKIDAHVQLHDFELGALNNWLGPNAANPGLRYVDTTANGYGLATVDKGEMRVQLITMENVRRDFAEPPAIRHVARFTVPLWRAGEAPHLAGPEFPDGAPFPFEQGKV